MRDVTALSMLKFRLSYGENGNQALDRYQTLARMKNEQYIFGDGGSPVPTIYVASMANQNLGWETTKVKNLGIDFGVLQNKLAGSIDVYSSTTSNILLERNIPGMSGYSSVWTNIGKVHNHGVELAFTSVIMQRNGLSWESGLTFTLNRNRIEELLGEDLDGDGKEDDNLANAWFIGEPLEVIYGYQVDGVHQLDSDIPSGFEAGDFRVVDRNEDGSVTPEDRAILVRACPTTPSVWQIRCATKISHCMYSLIRSKVAAATITTLATIWTCTT